MPHTKQITRRAPSKKVLRKKMEDKKLYLFWLKQWADHEYPGAQGDDEVFYEGTFDEYFGKCQGDFLFEKLSPGIEKGYLTIADEDGEEISLDVLHMEKEIVVSFHPEKLISKIHCYLSRSEMQEHYTALEECGWDVDDWENGKRAVYRS